MVWWIIVDLDYVFQVENHIRPLMQFHEHAILVSMMSTGVTNIICHYDQ